MKTGKHGLRTYRKTRMDAAMRRFELAFPTKVYFGTGIVSEAIRKERELFGKRTLVVMTGTVLERLGHLDSVKSTLAEMLGEDNVFLFRNVSPDPDIAEVAEAAAFGKAHSVDSVIGFGGGSAMDAAKAAAVGIASAGSLYDYLLSGYEPGPGTLPVITIPTTAGTGAEITKGAIISCREKRIKSGIRGKYLIPRLAVVDPVFTYGIPYNTTMETGFDVFSHATESYLSVKATAFSDMLSEKAIRNAGCYLRRLSEDLDDTEARDAMSFSSLLMGMNVRDIGNCLPHRMQYPVGALTGTSHGAGLAALYPAWIRYEYEVNRERVNDVLGWLGYGKAATGGEAERMIRDFINGLGLNRTLTGLGIRNMGGEELAGMVSGDLKNDRLGEVPGICAKIYDGSMGQPG